MSPSQGSTPSPRRRWTGAAPSYRFRRHRGLLEPRARPGRAGVRPLGDHRLRPGAAPRDDGRSHQWAASPGCVRGTCCGIITAQGDLEWLGSSRRSCGFSAAVTQSGVIGIVLFVLMWLLAAVVGLGAGLGQAPRRERRRPGVDDLARLHLRSLWLVIPCSPPGSTRPSTRGGSPCSRCRAPTWSPGAAAAWWARER